MIKAQQGENSGAILLGWRRSISTFSFLMRFVSAGAGVIASSQIKPDWRINKMSSHNERFLAIGTSSGMLKKASHQRQKMSMLLSGLLVLLISHVAVSAELSELPYLITDFDWIDQTRSRSVPARLYWPTTIASEAKIPLVVFSHGIGGSRESYSYLGKYWSARGIASLHVQHIGSDNLLWKGNPFSLIGRLQDAAQEQEAIARAADMSFALDRILSVKAGYYGDAVNQHQLIAAGHSYGANTTLLTVGAQVVRSGQTIDCLDPRFSAAVIISAPPFYGEADLSAVLSNVSVPSIHITATEDIIRIPGYYSGADDRIAIFDAVLNSNKFLAVFQGGSHSMFTDRLFTGGAALNPKVKIATAELALAFFNLVFEDDEKAYRQWHINWRSILASTEGEDLFESVRRAYPGN